jgi:cbb3-type cytochrome oxidase cytochrome c subunit
MKNGFSVFIAAFIALGASWCGFVLAPVLQLGTAKQTSVLMSGDTYPVQRIGNATLGLQVYRVNGCASCHTEQIQQDGVEFDVVLTGYGKNTNSVSNVVGKIINPSGSYEMLKGLKDSAEGLKVPMTILSDVSKEVADSASDKITAAGGKVETHLIPTGADIARGWGVRHSVAADFLYDDPVQLGSQRIGPDLANVGARFGTANLQLQHLYAPQSVVKNSAMPPFHFLFETRQEIGGVRSPDALNLPKEFAPNDGYEVVPTEDAKNLVAYLSSLRADAPLYEAPFTPPQILTNQVPTNAPAK